MFFNSRSYCLGPHRQPKDKYKAHCESLRLGLGHDMCQPVINWLRSVQFQMQNSGEAGQEGAEGDGRGEQWREERRAVERREEGSGERSTRASVCSSLMQVGGGCATRQGYWINPLLQTSEHAYIWCGSQAQRRERERDHFCALLTVWATWSDLNKKSELGASAPDHHQWSGGPT